MPHTSSILVRDVFLFRLEAQHFLLFRVVLLLLLLLLLLLFVSLPCTFMWYMGNIDLLVRTARYRR